MLYVVLFNIVLNFSNLANKYILHLNQYMLKLYNTLSNSLEEFKPIDKNKITLYVCGPTVYNEIHVGNARCIVVFDLLYRVLKNLYKQVVYVRNITDIDDKIINKANKESSDFQDIALFWEASFLKNCDLLNTLTPTHLPRATDTMHEIIESIGYLVDEGFAYFSEGHVFFRIDSIEEYGKLSNQNNVIEGKRVEILQEKESAQDFVLWKPSKINEPYWNSIWGKGRPGWHIECSAMSKKFLGDSFDIHAGGQDLIFPHHENEQAQNVALSGKYAGPNYWMHNAMINMDNEKMSKSLGNIVLLSEIFKQYDPIVVKFFILSTHYRHILSWKEEGLIQSQTRLNRWYYHLDGYVKEGEICQEVFDALLNDLNMPNALGIFETQLDIAIKKNDSILLQKLGSTLYFLGLYKNEDENLKAQLEEKLKERNQARKDKDYAKADELRNEILKNGYEIFDSANGSSLRRKF